MNRTHSPDATGVSSRRIAVVLAASAVTLVVTLLALSYPGTVAAVAVGAVGARVIPRVAAGVRTRLAHRRAATREDDRSEAVGS
ncbi:hypothetical protein [Haloglomus litoreum]|uniref:hypothetical protein n=1 Tax=Haloglomus litoreum TaxID=3034026 RepID=UPI0023E7BCEF|nr:hypothetical protein [Haloglomus sp. DT116]